MKPRNEIYNEGWKAAWHNYDSSVNPYTPFSSEYSHWQDGWFDGRITETQTEIRGMIPKDYE